MSFFVNQVCTRLDLQLDIHVLILTMVLVAYWIVDLSIGVVSVQIV
jgi:hypothetical protein